MKPNMDSFIKESVPNQTQANELMGRMFTAAQPGSLFSQPVVQGEYAVVMASEMIGGLGYGFGGGGGTGPQAEDGSAEGGFGGGGRLGGRLGDGFGGRFGGSRRFAGGRGFGFAHRCFSFLAGPV